MIMFEGKDAPNTLVIERTGAIGETSGMMTSRQTTFEKRYSFATNGDASAIEFATGANGAKLLTITDAMRRSTWDVSSAHSPVFVSAHLLSMLPPAASGMSSRLMHVATNLNRMGYETVEMKLPRIAGVRAAVLASDGQRNVLFDVTDPGSPKAVTTYHKRPWFDGTVASGKLLAKRRSGENRVDVYLATMSARDGELLDAQARKR
jgi:hypothetical protein